MTEALTEKIQRDDRAMGGALSRTAAARITAAGDTTEWIRFSVGRVTAQLSSNNATSVTAVVERSATDPAKYACPSPADADGLSGNPATGIVPKVYQETGLGWWRIKVTGLTGAYITAALSGEGD